MMYAQANMLMCKFNMCSGFVKTTLLRAFCTPMYTAHLWRCYRKSSMQKLSVAYNDGVRLLLKAPRWSSASRMFVSAGVPTCFAVLRHLMHKCMCRWKYHFNADKPDTQSVRFFSMWNHWRFSLYVNLWCCGFCLFLTSIGVYSVCCIVCVFGLCVSLKFWWWWWIRYMRERG